MLSSIIKLGLTYWQSTHKYYNYIYTSVFTVAERTQCNIRGKLGKGMLDKDKIDYIKLIAFRMFPLESSKETEKAAWNACITAIDEVNRRLNKPPKK